MEHHISWRAVITSNDSPGLWLDSQPFKLPRCLWNRAARQMWAGCNFGSTVSRRPRAWSERVRYAVEQCNTKGLVSRAETPGAVRICTWQVLMTSTGLRVDTVDQALLSGSEQRACGPGKTMVDESSWPSHLILA